MDIRAQIIRLASALDTSTRLLVDAVGLSTEDPRWMAWLSTSEWSGRADTEEGALRQLRDRLRDYLRANHQQRLRVIAMTKEQLAEDRAVVLRMVDALDAAEKD